VVSGDVDGDGFDDLAVGHPNDTLENPQLFGAGVVHELHGSPALLEPGVAATWERGTAGLAGPAQESDWFGTALAG
jgi:hypothetical protein